MRNQRFDEVAGTCSDKKKLLLQTLLNNRAARRGAQPAKVCLSVLLVLLSRCALLRVDLYYVVCRVLYVRTLYSVLTASLRAHEQPTNLRNVESTSLPMHDNLRLEAHGRR